MDGFVPRQDRPRLIELNFFVKNPINTLGKGVNKMINGILSAISALKTFEKKLSTSANNIANVNTQGFKKSRASSQEVSSQDVPASSGTSQIGRGTRLGTISEDFAQGSFESTSSTTDIAIGGNGFFMVKEPKGGIYYTRDGQFQLDKNGGLVTTAGHVIQGWEIDPNTGEVQGAIQDIMLASFYSSADGYGPGDLEAVAVSTNGVITGSYTNGRVLDLFQVAIAKFNNPQGLEKIGNNLYARTNESGDGIAGRPGTNGLGSIVPNALEQSNVDIGKEFVNIILITRGFQANLKVISTEDKMIGDLLNIIS